MTVCLIVGTGDRVTLPTADIILLLLLCVMEIGIYTRRPIGFYVRIYYIMCTRVSVFFKFFFLSFRNSARHNNNISGRILTARGKHTRHRSPTPIYLHNAHI